MNTEFMIIDNMPVAIEGEKNILAVIRKAGIELPTFCYYSELSEPSGDRDESGVPGSAHRCGETTGQ